METSTIIQCKQLVADTKDFEYLGNPLDMDANLGTMINMLGPDYSGKSDWLKTITGVIEPASGELYISQKNTDDMTRDDWVRARTKIAYVSSEAALLSAASAIQNILMPARYHNIGSPSEIRNKALQLLNDIDVDCNHNALPAYLRKDQRFKIAVARALILDPQVLILDNPFTLLDLSATVNFKAFLLDLVKNSNMLLIMATHDVNFAINNSDQLLFVTRDHIHKFGQGENIRHSEILEIRDYLDKSAMQ